MRSITFITVYTTYICALIFVNIHAFTFKSLPAKSRQVNVYSTIDDNSIDPNFEAHLPTLLKAGTVDRPSPELANDLRKRFSQITGVKREAAKALKTVNDELAIELEEIADELADTTEKFVQAALEWDAWGRPSPTLASELRAKQDLENIKTDPNYEAHLKEFLNKGKDERPDPELPSALRLMKFKNSAAVKRLAAEELKSTNPKLAQTLDEIASEIEESHQRFVELAASRNSVRYSKYN